MKLKQFFLFLARVLFLIYISICWIFLILFGVVAAVALGIVSLTDDLNDWLSVKLSMRRLDDSEPEKWYHKLFKFLEL